MNLEQYMDPELRAVFVTLPPVGDITIAPQASRRRAAELSAARGQSPLHGASVAERVTAEDRLVPGLEGAPSVPVRLYRPESATQPLSALLWIHGGGFVLGNLDSSDLFCRSIAAEVGCLVVSVAYRLAPEHPFPAAVEDCYAALLWLAAAASPLGVDQGRIAIGGNSAGGCLAAAVALMARDHQGPALALQLLLYPCLDDRHHTPSSHTITDPRTWNRQTSLRAWQAYLGHAWGSPSPYAAPLRATDLSRLPPAYILAAELDLLRDEEIAYATRLMQQGVTTELHVFPGAFHAFDGIAPAAEVSRRARAEYVAVLKRALSN